MTFRWALAGAVAAALLAGCDASTGESASKGTAPAPYTASSTGVLARAQQRVDDAYGLCVDKITGQLKAPATAHFSPRDPGHEAKDGDTYLFTGTVDSENSYGALLRSDWACQVRWTGTNLVVDSATVA